MRAEGSSTRLVMRRPLVIRAVAPSAREISSDRDTSHGGADGRWAENQHVKVNMIIAMRVTRNLGIYLRPC